MTAPQTDARQRRIAIVAAPAVLVVMYPIFLLTSYLLGDRLDGYLAWATGLAAYWLLWGTAFPLWVLGRPNIRKLLRPRRPDGVAMTLVALPAAVIIAERLCSGATLYQRSTAMVLVLLTVTALGNGFFEELLWRGVYLQLFLDRRCWRSAWPSLWFGLWHIAPVMSRHGPVFRYVVGATLLGFLLAFIARRSGGVFWPIVAHTGAALVAIA